MQAVRRFDRKRRDDRGDDTRYTGAMTEGIDTDAAWDAFCRRDRGWDGRVVAAIATTGIYCRPSCPARRADRAHVRFYRDGAEARAAGYRACLRCRPDEAVRDTAAVAAAAAMIADAEEPPVLAAVAAAVGYSPHHFHRLFTRATGMTPAAYARALRNDTVAGLLREGTSVTEAIHAAGYGAASRFYADAAPRLGMAPRTWAGGGRGETIRWTVATTSLGPLLVAATPRGLCRVAFDEDGDALAVRFPHATLVAGDADLAALVAKVVALVEVPGRAHDLPLDLRGTAFQEAVWAMLRAIPAGETRSYAQLAAAVGRPGAVRAAGSACGANPVAVAVPCHRVRRGDGGPGGYAWGIERKAALLERERERG